MKIVFDEAFDQGAWPGPLADKPAALGEAWVGPKGFLNMLETATGLVRPYSPPIERVLALVKPLGEREGFWSRSFERDPIGTASQIVAWSDALRSWGYQGEQVSGRIDALAEVTQDLPPGVPERLEGVQDAISSRGADVESVTLLAPIEQLCHAWIQVLEALESKGTKIVQKPLTTAKAQGDLLASRKSKFEPAQDGSLQLLRTSGAYEAADQVAAWLAGREDLSDVVVVEPDPLLDRALHRYGLPTTGAESGMYKLSVLSVLPLVISLGLDPQDPQHAADLLSIPAGPVPKHMAFALLEALSEWPAVGSRVWNQAFDRTASGIENEERRDRIKARVKALFTSSVKRGAPYPTDQLRKRISAVQDWLGLRRFVEKDEQIAQGLQAAWSQTENLDRLLTALGHDALGARELRLVIDAATESAAPAQPLPAQAGLRAVNDPGCVAGPAGCVVWWRFDTQAARQPAMVPLSAQETSRLSELGVRVPTAASQAAAMADRWRRPLLQAKNCCVLVCPRTGQDGQEAFCHPVWDEITARLTDWPMVERLTTERILSDPPVPVSTRELLPLPQPVSEVVLAPAAIGKREAESASSLETLIGCPFKYVLQYFGKLYSGGINPLERPESSLMLGRLAHEIIGQVVAEHIAAGNTDQQSAGQRARDLFDQKTPKMVAGLLLPGADATRAEARRVIAQASAALVRLLEPWKGQEIKVEKKNETKALGTKVTGRLDIFLPDPTAIVDMKWSWTSGRTRQLEAGTALQLAIYSKVTAESARLPPVAFFIIKDTTLLTTDKKTFASVDPVPGPGPDATWTAIETTCKARLEDLAGGNVTVGPVGQQPSGRAADTGKIVDGHVAIPPPCKFCDFKGLCAATSEA